MNLIKKLFIYPDWGVAFRNIKGNDCLPLESKKISYTDVPVKHYSYAADPFLFENDGETYLFVEYMSRHKGIGEIALSQYNKEKGIFLPFSIIISEPFHMSYPNVFRYKNEVYMLPETSRANKLLLYRAEEFPDKWVLDTVLLENVCYVDTSFYHSPGGKTILFTHDEREPKKVILFELDMERKEVQAISSEKHRVFAGRGGGNVICINEEYYRPLQDCEIVYGKQLKIVRLMENNGVLREKICGIISADKIDLKRKLYKPEKIHTINRTGNIEVIDYNYQRFYFDKPIKRMISRMKKHGN